MGNTQESVDKLKKMIREALLEQEKVDEGFIDRVLAKARGNVSGLKALGGNIGQVFKAVSTGKADFRDPKIAKAAAMASSRIKSYNKDLEKTVVSFASDLEALFGEGLGQAPDSVKQLLAQFGETSKQMMTLTQNIGKEVEKMVTNPTTSIQQKKEPDFQNEPEPFNASKQEPNQEPQNLGASGGQDEEDPIQKAKKNQQLRKLASVQQETASLGEGSMRFSAEQAQEAHQSGEPIMIPISFAEKIAKDHGLSYDELVQDRSEYSNILQRAKQIGQVDAWIVLSALGY